MATSLNFPSNPQVNDTYTYGSVTWVWNGSSWNIFTSLAINGDPLVNKLQVDSVSKYIDSSGNDMSFTDVTSGTKTLSQLVNPSFGTTAGTVVEGNDARLSDARTPTDLSVTYAKVANNLKTSATVTSTVDLSANGIGTITLSTNTAFSFTGYQLNKSYLLVVTANGYTPSFATAARHVFITGNETLGTSGTFYINLTCIDATSGSEKLLTMIMKGA